MNMFNENTMNKKLLNKEEAIMPLPDFQN